MRRASYDVPFGRPAESGHVRPAEAVEVNFFDRPGAFALEAMEVRMVEGDFDQAGPGAGWFRLLVPVSESGPPSPLETTCAAADFGNGVSNWDPGFSWMFINPELTIHFGRPPVGEWILLDSLTTAFESGSGNSKQSTHSQ